MTHFDDELRAALAPLAGDAGATRDAVLAQLPRRRSPWPVMWSIAAAAAAGLLVGYGIGSLGASPREVIEPGDQPPPPAVAATTPVARPRAVAGEVTLAPAADAARSAPLDLFTAVAAGDRITTGRDSYLELELAAGGRMRMAGETDLQLGEDGAIDLAAGHIWAEATGVAGLRIEQQSGTVETAPGAVVDVTAGEGALTAVMLNGRAALVARDGTRRHINKMQRCSIRGGILRDRDYVYSTTEINFWQLPLLCGQPRRAEIDEMAGSLIELIDNPDWGSMARNALRRMGECAMLPLLEFLARTQSREQLPARRHAAILLADIAGYRGLDALFRLLQDPDPQVRVPIYRAIARISGTDRVGAEFWTMAPARVREREAKAWQDAIEFGK